MEPMEALITAYRNDQVRDDEFKGKVSILRSLGIKMTLTSPK